VSAWSSVEQELSCWRRAGTFARFWVRDDDAVQATPQLERLSSLAFSHDIDVGLGVIPGRIGDDLISHLNSGSTLFYPMCHGWMHINHGAPGRPAEFGPERPLAIQIDDLRCALAAFRAAFDVPAVFVPPFNRINSCVARELPGVGFAALSSAPSVNLQRLARMAGRAVYLPGIPVRLPVAVRLLDVQIDPVDWSRETAQPVELVAETLLGELRIRRKGYVDPALPIGILLHHLIHDEAIWALSGELLAVLRGNPAVHFPRLAEIMPGGAHAKPVSLAAE